MLQDFLSLHLLAPIVIGWASGFQVVCAEFPSDALRSLRKLPTWAYLLSRAGLAVAAYGLWFQTKQQHDWLAALGCGAGAEIVLRSQFQLWQKKPSGRAKAEAVSWGVVNLLEWYQKLWLKMTGASLATERLAFIADLTTGQVDFHAAVKRARNKAKAWKPDVVRQQINEKLDEIDKAFAKESNPTATKHIEYIETLGYALLDLVGRENTRVLLSP